MPTDQAVAEPSSGSEPHPRRRHAPLSTGAGAGRVHTRGPSPHGTCWWHGYTASPRTGRGRGGFCPGHRDGPADPQGSTRSLHSATGGPRAPAQAVVGRARRPGRPARGSSGLREDHRPVAVGGARRTSLRVGHIGRRGQRAHHAALCRRARARRRRASRVGGLRGAVNQATRRRNRGPPTTRQGPEPQRDPTRWRSTTSTCWKRPSHGSRLSRSAGPCPRARSSHWPDATNAHCPWGACGHRAMRSRFVQSTSR